MSTAPQNEGAIPAQPFVPVQAVPQGTPYYFPPPPPPPRRGFWGRFFLVIFLFVLGGSFFLNLLLLSLSASLLGDTGARVQERYVSHDKNAEDKVVILPIEGLILESADGFVKRAIDTALKDDRVKAVVLRVDSPGGSVSGSDYLYHHLRKLAERDKKKVPIVVSMGSMAASGGYYVSMAVGHEPDTIFAEKTCFTGSIGVIIPHYSVAGFMQDHGLADDSIASNELKKMGSMTQPMTKAEKKIFEALINDSFNRFKEVIRAGRSEFAKNPAKLDALATGQIYSADQAVANKLVDKIGFVEDAVDRAIELANLDPNKVKVVRYKQEAGLSSMLLGGEAHRSQSPNLQALLEMMTPKAYYLVSWLPGLASAAK
jgi:protease IV